MVVNVDETLCPQLFNGKKLRRPQTDGVGAVHRNKGIKERKLLFCDSAQISGKKLGMAVRDRPRNEDFSFFA